MEEYRLQFVRIHRLSLRQNQGLAVLFVLRGRLNASVNGRSALLTEKDLCVLDRDTWYSLDASSGNVALLLDFPHRFLARECPGLLDRRFTPLPPDRDSRALGEQLTGIALLALREGGGQSLALRALLFQFLDELDRRCRLSGEDGARTEEEDPRLAPALALMRQSFRERLTLAQAARACFTTPQYLSRLFRERTGRTFSQHLQALRLRWACEQLLFTRDSVAKIAADSGFANEKALSAQFQVAYGATPAQYRRRHGALPQGESAEELEFLPSNTLEDLALVLSRELPAGDEADTAIELDLLRAEPVLVSPENLLDVGSLSQLLRADAQAQLTAAQPLLRCRYLRARLFDRPGAFAAGDAVMPGHDYFQVFSLCQTLDLTPQLVLSVPHLLAADPGSGPEEAARRLSRLLSALRRRTGGGEFRRWRMEVTGSPEQLAEWFPVLRRAAAGLDAGFCADGFFHEDAAPCPALAGASFATFSGDPNGPAGLSSAQFSAHHRDYYPKRLVRARRLLDGLGLPAETPLYLVDWNTLTGSSVAEAGEFHRSALLADTALRLLGEVRGFGLHLNLLSPANPTALPTYPLSLYIMADIPRPLLFCARQLLSRPLSVLARRDAAFLARTEEGDYLLALLNPCYVEPFHSVDNLVEEHYAKTLRLTLRGVPPGRYTVKRSVLDKANGSLYRSWILTDFSLGVTGEVLDSVRRAAAPALTVYQQNVAGELTVSQTLSMNAVAVYQITPL